MTVKNTACLYCSYRSALGQANLAVLCFVVLLNTNGDYNLQNIHHVVFSELYK